MVSRVRSVGYHAQQGVNHGHVGVPPFSIDIRVHRTGKKWIIVIGVESGVLGSVEFIFKISSLQPNGVTLTFVMIGLFSVDDVVGDLWWNKIVVPAFHHTVVDCDVLVHRVVLNEISQSRQDLVFSNLEKVF